MARAKAEKDAFQAEADKLGRKLQQQGKNVLVNGLSPNEELMELSVEWPDEPGKAFKLQVPWLVETEPGQFISGREYIQQGKLENKVNDVLLKKSLGIIKRQS